MTISQNGWSHVHYMYPLSLLSGQQWVRYIGVVCVQVCIDLLFHM